MTTFNEKLRSAGRDRGYIDRKLSPETVFFLEANHDKLSAHRIKKLISYFAAGKEIPYPLYKDREKVMNS